MQGIKIQENKLFYTVTLDRLVPQDHPVRRIAEGLDLSFLYEETKEYYSHEGKPSIDPVVLFKLYILGYFFGIPSERRLFREVQVAYRWYPGYDLDEEIPDHSIMTKSRYRFPKEVFSRLFKEIVRLCKEKGLISGDYYFMDSMIVRADASKESFRSKLLVEEKYLEGLDQAGRGDVEFRGYIFDGKVNTEKMGRRRERKKKSDEIYSRTDPDAELVTRAGKGTIPGYKAHLLVDRKERVILSIDGSKANEDDMSKMGSLYTESIFITGKKPGVVIGDKHYGGVEALKYFQDQGIKTCISPRVAYNLGGRFRNTDFKISEDGK